MRSAGFQAYVSNVFEKLRQKSKKLGKFLGKWNGETETRKLNKAKQFKQLTPSW